MSPAINQVVQNLLGRLVRVDKSMSTPLTPSLLYLPTREYISSSPDRIRGGGRSTRRYPPPSPVVAFSTHLATPRAISTPMRSKEEAAARLRGMRAESRDQSVNGRGALTGVEKDFNRFVLTRRRQVVDRQVVELR